jgi:hypothetical protein
MFPIAAPDGRHQQRCAHTYQHEDRKQPLLERPVIRDRTQNWCHERDDRYSERRPPRET